jgi:acetyl esterase
MTGCGSFNLVEGLVDHQWLGLHHVNDAGGPTLAWDMAFLAAGVLLVLGGLVLMRAGRRRVPAAEGLSGLEPEALTLALATADPPYLFQLGPEKGRLELDKVQSSPSPVSVPDTALEDLSVPGGPFGAVSIRIVRPRDALHMLPVILYVHGAGWVFGNAHTHDRLIRELAAGAGAAVVFVNYSLSPEAKYPIAIEETYAVARWIADQGAGLGLDAKNFCIAGDSVGGNMAAAVTLMARMKGGPSIGRQLLFYPVTDASLETPSYHRFATGYFLRRDGMQWFWKQYLSRPEEGKEITASPLKARLEELQGLPPALIITGEADVLRDEGEAYAAKLRQAGVKVTSARFGGMVHDFMMLNSLAATAAARGALGLAVSWLREGWSTPLDA